MSSEGVTPTSGGKKPKMGVTMLNKKRKKSGKGKPGFTKVAGDGAASAVQTQIVNRHRKLKDL
jgi:hypothetical protein